MNVATPLAASGRAPPSARPRVFFEANVRSAMASCVWSLVCVCLLYAGDDGKGSRGHVVV